MTRHVEDTELLGWMHPLKQNNKAMRRFANKRAFWFSPSTNHDFVERWFSDQSKEDANRAEIAAFNGKTMLERLLMLITQPGLYRMLIKKRELYYYKQIQEGLAKFLSKDANIQSSDIKSLQDLLNDANEHIHYTSPIKSQIKVLAWLFYHWETPMLKHYCPTPEPTPEPNDFFNNFLCQRSLKSQEPCVRAILLKVFNLKEPSDKKNIDSAYQLLARVWHPDKFTRYGDGELNRLANEILQLINQFRGILLDDKKGFFTPKEGQELQEKSNHLTYLQAQANEILARLGQPQFTIQVESPTMRV